MTNLSPTALALCAAAAASGCWMPTEIELGSGPDAGDSISPAGESALGAAALEVPYGVHLTWQRSPDTTLTFSWQTMAQRGYAPKVWLAPASLCTEIGENVFLPVGEEYLVAGAGEAYATGSGEKMEWIVEATGLEPDTEYCYRVGTWDRYDETVGALVAPRVGPVRCVRTGHP